ncbi:hypothetical protein K503DRAFT_869905 [Rhizopogon vinicolor AM-OR11-026]|uniref:Uncharacterized protein n=1 Tax=Rhizopogon vinicolor AM-OR11-026 TaxID=1314800 RepID=A0A1B7MJW1_9AGAM|nr:hypothetical protein K503DRAFT_869905 [Rhizopogon vinicolor AM-OR11-026]
MWPLRTSGSPSSSCDTGSKGLNRFAILEPVTKRVDNAFGGYYEESATSTACAMKSTTSRQCYHDLGNWAHYRSTGVCLTLSLILWLIPSAPHVLLNRTCGPHSIPSIRLGTVFCADIDETSDGASDVSGWGGCESWDDEAYAEVVRRATSYLRGSAKTGIL